MIESQSVHVASAPPKTKTKAVTRPAKRKTRKGVRGEDTIDAILLRLETLRKNGAATSDSESFVVGLTSCGRRSGVSTLCGKMALRAAELSLGHVLLIDANLEHPRQAKHFGLKRKEGLAEALAGDGEIEAKLFNGKIDGLTVMPTGAPSKRNMAIAPEGCSSLVKELRHGFNLIFVDLPPIADSAKFLVFAQQMDGLALVIDAKATRAREVTESIQLLEGTGVPIIGTILNRKTRTLPKWLDRWV